MPLSSLCTHLKVAITTLLYPASGIISGFYYYYYVSALGLCCYTPAFSSFGEKGLLARCCVGASHCGGVSCCGAQALWHRGFSSCRGWAQLPCSMWNLPGPGIEAMSPAVAGRFLTTGPRGKSCCRCQLGGPGCMFQPSFITRIHWEYQALVQFHQRDTFFFVSHSKFLGRLKGRLGWIWLTEVAMRIPVSLTIIQYKLTTNSFITNIIVITGQQDWEN